MAFSCISRSSYNSNKKLERVSLIQHAQVRREDAANAQRKCSGKQLLAPSSCRNYILYLLFICWYLLLFFILLTLWLKARDIKVSLEEDEVSRKTAVSALFNHAYSARRSPLTALPSPFAAFSSSQAFADEIHAREFRLPRREVECLTHKRAVMQASTRRHRIRARFTSSHASPVLCRQRRQRARVCCCRQSSYRMQQRFA
jgi:hypothetical protein